MNRKILIVEDEEGLAVHLQYLLNRMGCSVLPATAYGEEAVELAGKLAPDLVLMDINLAGKMDGIQAAALIRHQHDIPVVFLSALESDQIVREAQTSDPYAYLLKPVKEAELRAAIEVAVYKHAMERRLRESEARYRSLFESMSDGLALQEVICDESGKPVDYRFLAVNPRFVAMTGIPAENLVGRTVREAVPGENKDFYVQTLGRVAITGEPVEFERVVDETGSIYKFSAFCPQPGQFALIMEDVTARVTAERSLKESETRFRQLAESVREVFWLRARESGQMLYVNPAFERVWGRPTDDLYQNPMAMVENVHPEDRERVLLAQQMLHDQNLPTNVEYRIVRPDSSTRWIWARSFPVREDNNGVVRYSGIAEDITERKKSEEQLRESYLRLEQSLHHLTILRNIDLAITTYTDLAVMTGTILNHITRLSDIDAVALFVPPSRVSLGRTGQLLDPAARAALQLSGASGIDWACLNDPAREFEHSLIARVFTSGQPVFLTDLAGVQHPGAQAIAQLTGYGSTAALPLTARGQVKGVLQFFCKGQLIHLGDEWQSFLQSLSLQTAIAIDNVEMFEDMKRSNRELTHAYEETIKGWAQALELRDKETRGHAQRVVHLTIRLASVLGMVEPHLTHIKHGALLHDIGKMSIPDSILLKPDKLTADEWVIMRQHPVIAYGMLSSIEYLRPALDVVYYHHEKWDGTGYPVGLRGEEIPLAARIFAVVDVWDALTSDRPYRPGWPKDEALAYIIQQSGHHFDPRVVEAFKHLV